MNDKQHLVMFMQSEFATTLRVVRAFPGDKLDYRTHERSRSASELIQMFIRECGIIRQLVSGEVDMQRLENFKAQELLEYADRLELVSSEVINQVENASEADLNHSINFFGREMRKQEAIFAMVLDQIHHRGQLSVYIRLAGGKVPSIYGASADSVF